MIRIKYITPKILVLLAICFSSCSTETTDSSNPNVIFILADDMGYGDVSCYNENSKINTPNIDKLASNGVMFTDAHTSSAVCSPTRYGVLTGRYNWRSTLKRGVLSGNSKALIPGERMTIAGMLKENGYKTAGIGKWHLGWDWANADADRESTVRENTVREDTVIARRPRRVNIDFTKAINNGPTTLGFDYWYGFCASLDMPPYVWVENDMPTMVPTRETVNKGQAFWRNGLTSDDFVHNQVLPRITEKAVDFIVENAGSEQPFFVYMALNAPHTPILPTEEFQGKSGLDNPYGDFVIMVDAMVGRVIDAVDELGIAENTILIFTCDNGCSITADFEQLATKGHDPSYIFRGNKADIFEGGHRVPYIVRWPARVKPGQSDQLVCTTDLFATLADVIGITFEDKVAEDSYSYLPALKVKSSAEVRKSIVHHSINGSFAYRKNEWKVSFCPGSGGWSDPKPNSEGIENLPEFQLYNMIEDPAEENNLYYEHPEIVQAYKDELTEIIMNGRSTSGEKQKNDGPEKWIQLSWMDK